MGQRSFKGEFMGARRNLHERATRLDMRSYGHGADQPRPIERFDHQTLAQPIVYLCFLAVAVPHLDQDALKEFKELLARNCLRRTRLGSMSRKKIC